MLFLTRGLIFNYKCNVKIKPDVVTQDGMGWALWKACLGCGHHVSRHAFCRYQQDIPGCFIWRPVPSIRRTSHIPALLPPHATALEVL